MNTLWMPIREVAGVVYPSRPTLLRWSLHLAFWTVLLLVLWQLNRWGGLDRLVRSPWPILHRIWLPLLAVALYPLGWLGVGLWTALRSEPSAGVWPEVETAWSEAVHALAQAGIDPQTTPTFLILGPTPPEMLELLTSLGAVRMPQRAEAPFQVFAHRQTIYLACASLADLGRRDASRLGAEQVQTPLHHLCRLLRYERARRHAVQGIIVAVSFTVESASAVDDFIKGCRDDLHAVRQATGLELPIHVAVSGLTGAPIAAPHWLQQFPPLPDLDPAEIRSMYRLGLDWLFLERIPQQIRPLLQCAPASLKENMRLYQWLTALQGWRTGLEKVLTEATQTEDAEPGMVAGYYVLPPLEHAEVMARTLQVDLHKHKESACWTGETTAEYNAQRERVVLGYSLGALALALIALGGLSVWLCR